MKSFDIKPTNFRPQPSTAPQAATEAPVDNIPSSPNPNSVAPTPFTPESHSKADEKRSPLLIIILAISIVVLLAVVAALVFFYNQASSLRSELSEKNTDLKSAQVKLSVLNQSTDDADSAAQSAKTDNKTRIVQATSAWFNGQTNFAGQLIKPQIANSDSTYALTTAKTDYDDFSCALKNIDSTWLVVACATDLPVGELSSNWGFPTAILMPKD